jgi:hypothetical protein
VSRPCFQFDEDIHRPIILRLRRLEPHIKLFTARDAGLLHEPDDRVLEVAAENRRLLVSHDVRTLPAAANARIASGLPMWGLILIPQARRSEKAVIDDLALIYHASEGEDWIGRIAYLPL